MAVRLDQKSDLIDRIVRYVIDDEMYQHSKVTPTGEKEYVDFALHRDSARIALKTQLQESMVTIEESDLGEESDDIFEIYSKKDFMNTLKRAFLKSFVTADYSAGFEAAFAVGSNATQQTLNSFHLSGALKETDGAISSIVNIAAGSSNPEKSLTTVLFEEGSQPRSFYDILKNKRKDFVETRFDFYIEEERVTTIQDLQAEPEDHFWWYDSYSQASGENIAEIISGSRQLETPESIFEEKAGDVYLAVYKLDVDKMFSFEVTPVQIVRELTKVANDKFLFVCSPLIQEEVETIMPELQPDGSTRDVTEVEIRPTCYIHCYALPDQHDNIDLSLPGLEISLLQTNGLRIFEKVIISGIKGVRQVQPDVIDVTMMLQDCEKVDDAIWNCYFDPVKMDQYGITDDRIRRLLIELGYHHQEEFEGVVDNPNSFSLEGKGVYDLVVTINSKENPQQEIFQQVAAEKQKVAAHISMKLKERTKLYSQGKVDEAYALNVYDVKGVSTVQDLNEIYSVKALGANLLEFWKVPGVNPYLTFSSHFHEINHYLGMEATRNILGIQFHIASGYGGYIDPRHVLTVIDRICHPAYIRGFRREKFDRENYSALTRFLVNAPSVVMGKSAALGESHEVLSPIESIMVGGDPNFGTTSKSTRIEFDEDFDELIKSKKVTEKKKHGPGSLSKNVIRFNIMDDYVKQKQLVVSTPEGGFETTRGGSIQPVDVPEEEKVFIRANVPARMSIYGDMSQLAKEENELDDVVADGGDKDDGADDGGTFEEFVRQSRYQPLGKAESDDPYKYQTEDNSVQKVQGIDVGSVLDLLS